MKTILYLILLFPITIFCQTEERYWNRELIDSIHSKRLCTDYPGMTRVQTTKEALDESKLVFTGKVIEIIRIEKMDSIYYLPPPLPTDGENTDFKSITPEPTEPIQHYWYVLKPIEIFKGEKKEAYKIYSRIFSTISPLLILNKKYLIYAMESEIQKHPYIYCNGNSCHIEYAEREIMELKELTKK